MCEAEEEEEDDEEHTVRSWRCVQQLWQSAAHRAEPPINS